MKRAARVVWALSVVCVVSFGVTLLARQQPAVPAAKPMLKEPMRGTAFIEVLKPVVKVVGKEVVTSLKVKNASFGAIAGLRVDEYWYDGAGNVIGGDTKRQKTLMQPGEIITFELHTPRDPKMKSNSYQFTHANGKIQAKSVPKF
jgi:hypothetical protein